MSGTTLSPGPAATATGPRLAGATYRPADADQRADLARRFDTDQAFFGAELTAAAVVRRLEVTAAGIVALELGEAPTAAYAPYESGSSRRTEMEICGVVSGAPRFDVGAASVTTVPVADLLTTGWGWHDLERDAGGPFRWSDGRETELLLQLTQIGSIRVEIDASAAAVDLTNEPVTVTLVVNGTDLTAHTMARDIQTYAWPVPASFWKTGINSRSRPLSARLRSGSATTRERSALRYAASS